MNFLTKLFRSRDKPQNSYHFSGWPFMFGKSAAGKSVNEFIAMQNTAVYACVRILAESVAGLPLHVYEYRGNGKERVPGHPLYFLLHDSPNPEMTSFIFRETSMIHLLLWGNSYAQILRDGMGRVVGLLRDDAPIGLMRRRATPMQWCWTSPSPARLLSLHLFAGYMWFGVEYVSS